MSGIATRDRSAPAAARPLLGWARDLVTPALRDEVGNVPAPEARVVGYHRGWTEADGTPLPAGPAGGGKAVRPALVLLSAQAVGGAAEDAVPGAVAVELVHDFSLLHDDVIDGDRLRRHRPAAWTVFGTPAAVLTGDALLVCALRTLGRIPAPAGHLAVREMLSMLAELMVGQSQDVAFEDRRSVEVDQYLAMAAGKTGALMGTACALGGLLAGAPERRVDGLRDFGRCLGVAFQCVDDLLGIWGASDRSGKPVGADIAARKKSLPVVAALADPGEAGRCLAELLQRPGPLGEAEVARAVELVERAGGRERTEQEVRRQTSAAMRALARAEPSPEAYRRLHDLALLLTGRDH